MNNSIEQPKTMHLEDAFVLALNTAFGEVQSTPEEDEKSKNDFKDVYETLFAIPIEKYPFLKENQLATIGLIKTAEIYARAKWEEACIATRKSMTEESGLMPQFNP